MALPQYQKVVEKSKATQAITLLKSVVQAAESYKLANGSYPASLDELAVEIPWTGHQVSHEVEYTKDSRANGDWSLELYDDGAANATEHQERFFMFRLRGKYKGAGFVLGSDPDAQQLRCVEKVRNGSLLFSGQDGDYCVKIMKGTYSGGFVNRYYTLPS